MAVRIGAADAIDHGGLGRAELHPLGRVRLDGAEELLGAQPGLVVDVVFALELGLEGELADERGLGRAIPPDGDGGLGLVAVAEVEVAGVDLHAREPVRDADPGAAMRSRGAVGTSALQPSNAERATLRVISQSHND